MPKIKNAKVFKHLKLTLVVCLLFLISAIFLLATPQVVSFAQYELTKTSVEPEISPQSLYPKVVLKAPVLTIENLGIINPPNFSAQAVMALDLDTGKIIYQKNINDRLSPASTTKLLTALVALDHYKSSDILQVYPEDIVGGSSMDLVLGEKLTFRSLLYGMLLNSGNDAAFTMASNYPGGLPMFVLQMNKKAIGLGLKNSHFENPAGFDSENHYSSAYDLSEIAKVAASDPELTRVVSTKETLVTSIDNTKVHNLKNLNKLLGESGVVGIKTGFTEKSGENLVGLVERNDHKVLTVVLNSKDRFGETKALMDWIYQNFIWKLE